MIHFINNNFATPPNKTTYNASDWHWQ